MSRIVARLVRMLERPFNDHYLMSSPCISEELELEGFATKEISYTFPRNPWKSTEIKQNHWKSTEKSHEIKKSQGMDQKSDIHV